MDKKVLWTVSLSNGETFAEGKGEFEIVEGALSPWLKLQDYLKESDVFITSLSLYTRDGMRWNIPSMGKNPKFKEFAEIEKPTGYRFFRKYGVDQTGPNTGVEDHYAVIEAVYGDRKIQTWVDDSTLNSWSLIK
jgi:hypothetical protein